jgi:hypothetical protein
MSALAQCDAFAFIYDQAGDPAPDVLVVLKRVLDASGNPILLGPKTTLTDSAGAFHFTLPELGTAFISARASALWNCPDGRAFTVPPGPSGELVPDFSLPASTLVEPPLVYVGDVLSIPKASETQDGYLSAADFVRFEAGAADMGITQINTGAGLTGGPITETGTIALLPVSGVAGTWSNPTSISINAYGQIIAITATADTTAPAISAITATPTGSGATITWTTDDPSDSQVEYGTTTSYGSSTTLDATPVTSHSVPITGTPPLTLYHYRVKSRNTAGLLTTSGDNTFTTTAATDTTPPVISAIASSGLTATGATITWTTNEASDSQVEYGLTTSYGTSTTLNTSMVTSHSVPLTGLTASTLYHYRVKSKDGASPPNLATSTDNTFTTVTPDVTPPAITLVASSGLTENDATITWTTNEPADSQVQYGTTTAYGTSTTLDATLVTSHTATITGLLQNTLYHYHVLSRDAAGNLQTSGDFTFTTLAGALALTDNLVSYWQLNAAGTSNQPDSVVANHNDMVPALTVGSTAGKVGNAINSTAASGGGFTSCASNASLDFTGKPLTITGWLKIHGSGAGFEFSPMLSKWYAPSTQDFLLWYRSDTHQFEFTVTSNGTSATAVAADVGGTATLEHWYFLCAIYDRPNNQIKLSVDNGTFSVATFTGPSIFFSSQALAFLTGAGQFGDCAVDEIGIWDRVLTSTEITRLFSEAGITYPF